MRALDALIVFVGSGVGGVLRLWTGLTVTQLTDARLPWGTWLINIVGSFVIGLFGAWTRLDGNWPVDPGWRLFVMVGLCGGYTTFSAFSLQTLELLQAGETGWALAYIAGSVIACLLAVWAGVVLGR